MFESSVSLGINQFSYCTNNPINQVDHTGHKPGDLFDTEDEAAINASYYYGSLSVINGWEYGVSIYPVVTDEIVAVEVAVIEYRFSGGKTTQVTYSTVTSQRNVIKYTYGIAKSKRDPMSVSIPYPAPGDICVAMFHTHPKGSDVGKTYFSDVDKMTAFNNGVPMYVYGPNGVLAKYEAGDPGIITIWMDLPVSHKKPWLQGCPWLQ